MCVEAPAASCPPPAFPPLAANAARAGAAHAPPTPPPPPPPPPRHYALAQKYGPDLPACGSQCAQNPDLVSPLRHRDLKRVVDDEHPDEQRERAGDVRRQRINPRHGLKLLAARSRRLDFVPFPQSHFQLCRGVLHSDFCF